PGRIGAGVTEATLENSIDQHLGLSQRETAPAIGRQHAQPDLQPQAARAVRDQLHLLQLWAKRIEVAREWGDITQLVHASDKHHVAAVRAMADGLRQDLAQLAAQELLGGGELLVALDRRAAGAYRGRGSAYAGIDTEHQQRQQHHRRKYLQQREAALARCLRVHG